MDACEAGHDSSLTANTTKSFGNPYDIRAIHHLTGTIFVAALVKYVEGNGDTKKVFSGRMKSVAFHLYTLLRS